MLAVGAIILVGNAVDVGMGLWDAYQFHKAMEAGDYDKAQEIAVGAGIGVATEVAVGAIPFSYMTAKMGYKVARVADDVPTDVPNSGVHPGATDGEMIGQPGTGGAVHTGGEVLSPINDFIDLTNGRSGHILANHGPGVGKPGKTEFPASWDNQRIVHQVSDIASDPSLVRQADSRGTPYVIGVRDGVEIRVNFFPKGSSRAGQIATAYPINIPANPRSK